MANLDFLRFNAYSIKDLIKRKLSEDSNFTDQVYEGSNLAVLIDIFSYMANCILLSLNQSAAESMMKNTQIYENMNKLCNFLGYNPKGMSPAHAQFALDNSEIYLKKIIPRYSYIDTGKTDTTGRRVFYSTGGSEFEITNTTTEITLYAGQWKLYSTVFYTSGSDWETFDLTNLKSDFNTNDYVAHGMITVYVETPSGEIFEFRPTDEQLFKPSYLVRRPGNSDDSVDPTITLYGGTLNSTNKTSLNHVFNVRLNENKNYVITFGDGTTGAKPPVGSKLYIVYFDGNSGDSDIELAEINGPGAVFTWNRCGLTDEFWIRILGQDLFQTGTDLYRGQVVNVTPSQPIALEENVEELRENAPNWFRMGNRLVTKNDYEYYIKTSPTTRNKLIDVKCQNNWEYISTFYKWLYDLGVKTSGDPTKYLNQNRLVKNDYMVADPADCNNIYLWCMFANDNIDDARDYLKSFKDSLMTIKDMTHEPCFMKAIPVNFMICGMPTEQLKSYFASGDLSLEEIDEMNHSYLEVTITDDVIYSNATIMNQIVSKIQTFFERKNVHLGQLINFSNLMDDLYTIPGVSRIRTIYYENIETNNPLVFNGISFASWSIGHENLIDLGDDLEVSNMSRSLEVFQYARLDSSYAIKDHIRIIRHGVMSLNKIQY